MDIVHGQPTLLKNKIYHTGSFGSNAVFGPCTEDEIYEDL